jgi:molecular chaperone GrpE
MSHDDVKDPFQVLFDAAENAVDRIRDKRTNVDENTESPPEGQGDEVEAHGGLPGAPSTPAPPMARTTAQTRRVSDDRSASAAVTASLIKARNELGELLAQEKKAVNQLTADNQRAQGRSKRLREKLETAQGKAERAKDAAVQQAREKTITALLPVLDNLQRALQADLTALLPDLDPEVVGVLSGIETVSTLFESSLKKLGVQGFSAVGQTFDPAIHEAIRRVSDPSQAPNTVVEEYHRGYLFEGRLLRPALVVVATV